MNRYARIALAAAVAAAGTAHAASAQLPVIPYGPVNTGLGINVSADYGKPTSGGGSAWGVSAGLGLSRLGISASFGGFTPNSGSSQTAFAGMAGLKLFGGGLTPVEIGAQVGANHVGSFTAGSLTTPSTTNVMPAAWVKVSPPLFPLKPWAQVYDQISNQLNASGKKSELRFAVGANFNLLLGLGVHAGYDFGTGTGSAKSWGIGAHMNFRVPSLGVPGM
jgi:hypothetical protein